MFTIFIMHTSFQLYHCTFPAPYLRAVRYPPPGTAHPNTSPSTTAAGFGAASAGGSVTLRCTRQYDFTRLDDRADWLDILVALVLYLRSGESRVGYLSRGMGGNRLHKEVEEEMERVEAEAARQAAKLAADKDDADKETVEDGTEVDGTRAPRRSTRKRPVETAEQETETAPRKARRRRRA